MSERGFVAFDVSQVGLGCGAGDIQIDGAASARADEGVDGHGRSVAQIALRVEMSLPASV